MIKLIKLSTCLICLGTLISGLSATAMEDNDWYVERNRSTVENNNSERNKDEKFREVYEQQIEKVKSDTYARKYADVLIMLNLSEEVSRKIAEDFEKERLLGNSPMISKGQECLKKTNIAPELKKIEENPIAFMALMFRPEQKSDSEKMEESKPELEIDVDSEIDEKASDKSIKESFNKYEKFKHDMILLYNRQREEGKSKLYSVEYVRQYYKMIKDNKRTVYAKTMASLFEEYVSEGLSQKEAREKAFLSRSMVTNENLFDLDLEVDETMSDESIEESLGKSGKFGDRMISIYNRQRKIGKSKVYSVEYVRQFFKIRRSYNINRTVKKIAGLFEKYVSEGMSYKEARKKALGHSGKGGRKPRDLSGTAWKKLVKSKENKGLDSEPPEKMPKVSTPSGCGLEIDLDIDSSEESEIESGTESETDLDSGSESETDDETPKEIRDFLVL